MDNKHENPATDTESAAPDTGRREALLKMGKYGAYVAPAVLALVVGKRAEAVCSIC